MIAVSQTCPSITKPWAQERNIRNGLIRDPFSKEKSIELKLQKMLTSSRQRLFYNVKIVLRHIDSACSKAVQNPEDKVEMPSQRLSIHYMKSLKILLKAQPIDVQGLHGRLKIALKYLVC
jgi:hypothetical protein